MVSDSYLIECSSTSYQHQAQNQDVAPQIYQTSIMMHSQYFTTYLQGYLSIIYQFSNSIFYTLFLPDKIEGTICPMSHHDSNQVSIIHQEHDLISLLQYINHLRNHHLTCPIGRVSYHFLCRKAHVPYHFV